MGFAVSLFAVFAAEAQTRSYLKGKVVRSSVFRKKPQRVLFDPRFVSQRLLSFALSLFVALIFAGNPLRTFAAGGALDLSFGGNGKVATDFNGGEDIGSDVAIQPNGRIVVVGYSSIHGRTQIARYHANGSLDTTFNGSGKIIGLSGSGRIYSVVIQSDGKIVVGGSTNIAEPSFMFLERYTANGTPDTTFGNNGRVVITDFHERLTDLAIQTDGKIIAAGNAVVRTPNPPFFTDWRIVRLNTNGSLDNTFGNGGIVNTDFGGNTNESAQAASILSNGRILVAGYGNPGGQDFALAQYTTNGSLDINFGSGGKVLTDFASGDDRIHDMKVQPDGKIVAAGFTITGGSRNFALARYNSNGTLDTTFDVDGKVETNLNTSGHDSANGLALQSDGKIIAVGDNGNVDFSLARYNPNGGLDTNFGQSGILFTDLNNSTDTANAVAMQADGKIVVAGAAHNSTGGTTNFAVVRYLPNMANPTSDFDGDGKTDISIFRPPVGEWWINRSSTGVTYAAQFGQSTDKITPGDFTGDGKTDIAFFRPSTGFWFVLRSEDFSFYAFPWGNSTDLPTVGDFDGDAKADAAVFRPSTATWYIQKSSGGIIAQTFGANGDIPVIGDYDGDGKADIAIYRPSLGQWWIQRSQSGSIFATSFGSSTDKPVAGDYTGDGKTDLAFFRPSTGEWFVLRSENQSYYAFPFGSNGDIPAPGDYDGDGKSDAAVFRPSNNTWYLNQTTAGVSIRTFGSTGDVPVPSASFLDPAIRPDAEVKIYRLSHNFDIPHRADSKVNLKNLIYTKPC